MLDTRFSMSVQIMMSLAYKEGELLNSEKLARTLKSNPTFVRKLVSNLVEAELVESFRGKGGGIRLARAPSDISLKDIFSAATEEKKLISCHSRPVTRGCPVSSCIQSVLDDIINGIDGVTKTFLSRRTLLDLMKKVK